VLQNFGRKIFFLLKAGKGRFPSRFGDVITNSNAFHFAKTVNITVKSLGLIDS